MAVCKILVHGWLTPFIWACHMAALQSVSGTVGARVEAKLFILWLTYKGKRVDCCLTVSSNDQKDFLLGHNWKVSTLFQ